MTTKFIHLREIDNYFDHTVQHYGGFTVAYDVILNGDGSPEKVVYAISACHQTDLYNKAKGRTLAEGRLLCRRGNKVRVLTYDASRSVSEQVLRDLNELGSTHCGLQDLLTSEAERQAKAKRHDYYLR